MSKYTTEVRYICETYAGLDESAGYDDVNDIISNSEDKIFEEYEIFDENYRSILNQKILRHYYTREICAETVGLWKLWLNNTMNEIMPYYNQLYKSALLKFNPLYDVDLATSHLGTENGTNERVEDFNKTSQNTDNTHNVDNLTKNDNNFRANSNEKTENKEADNKNTENVNSQNSMSGRTTDNGEINKLGNTANTVNTTNRYSDTPQGGLNGMQSVENNMYLTNATINDQDGHILNQENTDTSNVKNENKNENAFSSKVNNLEENVNVHGKENGTVTETLNGTQNRVNDTNRTNIASENNAGNATEKYNSLNQYAERVAGKRNGMTYSAMLNEFRSTFLNIDMMIIKDLANLFFKLY